MRSKLASAWNWLSKHVLCPKHLLWTILTLVVTWCALNYVALQWGTRVSWLHSFRSSTDALSALNTLILSITLLVLLKYTIDTSEIARTTKNNMYMPNCNYLLEIKVDNDGIKALYPIFTNNSPFYCEGRISLSVKINNAESQCQLHQYMGNHAWKLFPGMRVVGFIDLLKQGNECFGRTIEDFQTNFELISVVTFESMYNLKFGPLKIVYRYDHRRRALVPDI